MNPPGPELSLCPNCDHALPASDPSNYCPNCGQHMRHQRFKFGVIVREAASVAFNLERGLLYTAGKLTVSPGEVVRNYWDGITRRYYNPLRYAFIMVTLSTLVTLTSGVYEKQVSEISGSGNTASWVQPRPGMTEEEIAEQRAFQDRIQQETKKYLSVFSLLTVPVGAFALWLLFRDRRKYMGELMIATAYYIGHTSLFSITWTIAAYFDLLGATGNMALSSLFNLIYGVFMLKHIFRIPWWRAVLSGPAALLLVIVISTVILLLLGLIIGMIVNILQ